MSIVLNGETLVTTEICGDSGEIELPLAVGANTVEFVLRNGPPGDPGEPAAVTWHYELRRNGSLVAFSSCGQACVEGCKANADYPQGEVFRYAYAINDSILRLLAEAGLRPKRSAPA